MVAAAACNCDGHNPRQRAHGATRRQSANETGRWQLRSAARPKVGTRGHQVRGVASLLSPKARCQCCQCCWRLKRENGLRESGACGAGRPSPSRRSAAFPSICDETTAALADEGVDEPLERGYQSHSRLYETTLG